MNRPLRVAVVGCGDISVVHLDAIVQAPEAELVGVSDTDQGRREAAAAAHGVVGYADHLELFAQVRPDVVHVCTPHAEHAQVAVDALERGIHVLTEKPLAATREDGTRMAEAAARSTAQLGVCFQNRYNTAVRRAKEILDSGELGDVHGARASVLWHRAAPYYRSRPWRGTWAGSGGGLLMNQAIHTVDLLQWLVGDVAAVTGSVATRVLGDVIEVEDTAEMVLEHASGARSVLFATLAHIENAPVEIEVVAENGRLLIRGDLVVTRADGSTEHVVEDAMGSGDRAYWGGAHVRLIHDFYRSLDGPVPFWIDAFEAQKSLEIIQDVYEQSYPERFAPSPAPAEWSTTS
ncbi:Gfo/Idh/MocA family protein [Agromyces sp. NPDC058484]|uniref:Gfo/Idh/MocA family protein n=1 Tax=Agromyces sp. NPDC058484 TaxID=3346524 RepID=UPI00366734D9